MIHEVSGDILLSGAAVVANGVAPGDHFEHGLALSLRESAPAMVKDFRHYCHTASPKPGAVWTWPGPNGKRIANLMVQDAAPGEHGHSRPGLAQLEHVNHALRNLRKIAEEEGWTSIALPRLACGAGALSWSAVRPLIDQHLGSMTIPIIVYAEYKKGVKAKEPKLGD